MNNFYLQCLRIENMKYPFIQIHANFSRALKLYGGSKQSMIIQFILYFRFVVFRDINNDDLYGRRYNRFIYDVEQSTNVIQDEKLMSLSAYARVTQNKCSHLSVGTRFPRNARVGTRDLFSSRVT